VVVGGGPTSVEFASELYDFLRKDVHKWYPDLEEKVRERGVRERGGERGIEGRREEDFVSWS